MKKFSIIVFLFFFLFLYAEPACRQAGAETLSYIDAFDQADTNRDGYVSPEEAEANGLLDAENFEQADSDMDGLLSLREAKGAKLQLPKTEEEKPLVQKEEVEAQTDLAKKEQQQVEEPAEIPPEIQEEQEKLGIAAQPTPAVKPRPRPSARQGISPARTIQGSRRPRSAVGAPGNAMPPQGSVRGQRRPPSFAGKRVPKPPASTTPKTTQPQPPAQ